MLALTYKGIRICINKVTGTAFIFILLIIFPVHNKWANYYFLWQVESDKVALSQTRKDSRTQYRILKYLGIGAQWHSFL